MGALRARDNAVRQMSWNKDLGRTLRDPERHAASEQCRLPTALFRPELGFKSRRGRGRFRGPRRASDFGSGALRPPSLLPPHHQTSATLRRSRTAPACRSPRSAPDPDTPRPLELREVESRPSQSRTLFIGGVDDLDDVVRHREVVKRIGMRSRENPLRLQAYLEENVSKSVSNRHREPSSWRRRAAMYRQRNIL